MSRYERECGVQTLFGEPGGRFDLSNLGRQTSRLRPKERSAWDGQLRGTGRSGRMAFPLVAAKAVEDTRGEGDGIAARFTVDPRRRAFFEAVHEVRQFAGQLIALGIAVEVKYFEVSLKKPAFQHRACDGTRPAGTTPMSTEI